MTEKPLILVDSREQTPWRFSPDVNVERVTLSSGDYSLAGFTETVAIERKSLPDLVACVGRERERFLRCCQRLREYRIRAVVVEANYDDVEAHAYRSRTLPQSVIGTILALHADYELPTIWAGSAQNAAKIVEKLLTRIWRKAKKAAA